MLKVLYVCDGKPLLSQTQSHSTVPVIGDLFRLDSGPHAEQPFPVYVVSDRLIKVHAYKPKHTDLSQYDVVLHCIKAELPAWLLSLTDCNNQATTD